MLIFNQSYISWSLYEQRDLMYKLNLKNVHTLPKLSKFTVTKKKTELEDIYSNMSALILLFEQEPTILRLKHSIDNKLKNTILGAKISLKAFSFFSFFFRYKNEENNVLLFEKLLNNLDKNNGISLGIHIKQNLFDEFLILYDKFATISEIFLTWHFINCKTKEEKKLLLSNLFLF